MSALIEGVQSCSPADKNSHPLPLPAQQRICRHCNGELEALYQPPLLPGRSGYWYLTCWNPCALHGYTFTNNTYPTMDLTPYLETEQSS